MPFHLNLILQPPHYFIFILYWIGSKWRVSLIQWVIHPHIKLIIFIGDYHPTFKLFSRHYYSLTYQSAHLFHTKQLYPKKSIPKNNFPPRIFHITLYTTWPRAPCIDPHISALQI